MFVRITSIDFSPEHLDKVRKIFNEEVIPVVKSQKGNLGIWLLEPADQVGEYISLTEWKSKEDAAAYESSGVYRQLVDKLKDMYRSKPVLKTYHVIESKLATTF